MKKVFIILTLCLMCTKVLAQEKPKRVVNLFEVELFGAGMAFPLSNVVHYSGYMEGGPLKVIPGLNYDFAIRFNISGRPHSIGLQHTLADFHKHKGELCEQASLANVELFYDYNFKQGKWFNPFVSLGVGYSYAYHALVGISDNVNGFDYTPYAGGIYDAICFTPRIGFEIFKCLRFTFSMTYIDKRTSFYGFTVGMVIGGYANLTKR